MNKQSRVFDPINCVKEVGGRLLTMGVNELLGDEDKTINCALGLHELVTNGAYTAVKHQCWDYSTFLTHYPVFKAYFDEAEYNVEQERLIAAERVRKLAKAANDSVTVYCPRGCNQIKVSAHHPHHECAACGQGMTREAVAMGCASARRSS